MRTRQTVPKAGAWVPGARCAPLPPSALSSARAPRRGADPCCPIRVAETPGPEGGQGSRSGKRKKSPPGTPERRPATPPLPVSRPVTRRRLRDRGRRKRRGRGRGRAGGRRGARRRGRALEFLPSARRPGVPQAPAARAPGGWGGVWAAGPATPPRASCGASSHPEAEEGGPAAASTSTTAPPAEGSAL